jgi:hypothetical protein
MEDELKLYGDYLKNNIDVLRENLDRFHSFLKQYDLLEKAIKELQSNAKNNTMVK